MRDFSSTTPMKTKSGMAISTVLVRMPNTRCPSAPSSDRLKSPSAAPSSANSIAVPAMANAAGKPERMAMHQAGEHQEVEHQISCIQGPASGGGGGGRSDADSAAMSRRSRARP